jgi:hypothetical protein
MLPHCTTPHDTPADASSIAALYSDWVVSLAAQTASNARGCGRPVTHIVGRPVAI